jgi:di/tricarboxylate transporter
MTLEQALAFALVGGAIGLFIWGRFRYDLVALAVLLIGVLVGVVPAEGAFSGFSDDVVVIIAAALVISAAVSRSGVVEALLAPLTERLTKAQGQVALLVLSVTLLSMVTKNVGALAIMMPVALQLARRTGTSLSCLLMPMAFASLLGGLVTLVGTSPNILVSEVRERTTGEPFGMFDYTPVGLALALGGALFLIVGYRLLPKRESGAVGLEEALAASAYVTEVKATVDAAAKTPTVSQLQDAAGEEVSVTAVVRHGETLDATDPHTVIQAGDRVLLEGAPKALEQAIARASLTPPRDHAKVVADSADDEVVSTEAVVRPGSRLRGRSAADLHLYRRYGVNLIAISRQGQSLTGRLKHTRLRPGDLIVLQGASLAMPRVLQELGCLPLVRREIALGGGQRRWLPLLILAAAMTLVALEVLPVAIAFFGAAVLMMVLGSLRPRQAYEALEGPVLVLIAALIPISDAIRATGGTDLIAGGLSALVTGLPPLLSLGVVMAGAMAVTPFLNNAATVLVLGPIGVSLAKQLNLDPDPFLMAVAVGAACDFLTPVGHQCNTLVMGPGGYRFGDYWRLGAPLSAGVLLCGTPLIAAVWPLLPA